MSARVTLSPNDSLWLNMDSPENLMVIEGVMWFDEPLEPEAVTRALRERMVERGGIPDPLTPQAYADFIKAEVAKWGEVARNAKVRLD